MSFLHLLSDPGILLVIITFVSITAYCVKKMRWINKEVSKISNYLSKFNKSELSFRFKELDEFMSSNSYVSSLWKEFRATLMFSESISVKDEKSDIVFQDVTESISTVQSTVDPELFFNEESLATSKYNYKFVQTAPTLLTGLGPLFTFMHIGIAFSKIDFSSQEATIASVSGLMSSMQAAAMVSVLAVSTSLLFLMIERISYGILCKTPVNKLKVLLSELFESISSEKFLIELLKETKIQNNSTKNILALMPNHFKTAVDKSLTSILVPYLENMVYGLNKLQEKITVEQKKNADAVDELF